MHRTQDRTGYLQPRLPNAVVLAYGGGLAASGGSPGARRYFALALVFAVYLTRRKATSRAPGAFIEGTIAAGSLTIF
jgi:hypothetical protein